MQESSQNPENNENKKTGPVNMTENKTENQETKENKKFELLDLGWYNKELSKNLPASIFKPTPERAGYLFLYLGINIALVNFVLNSESVILKAIAGVWIGIFNGGMAFMAHEILHGSIVKSKKLQDWFGFIGFAPFMISPTFWKYWHNRLHHGKTQNLAVDPDCFPNLAVYRRSKFMKWAFRYTPGSGYIRSYFYFTFWFMFQAFLSQAYFRFHNKNYKSVDQQKVTIEFAIMIVIFLVYAQYVGMANWIYLLVIPFMAQNYTVMSYISTNHNLNPLTKINDPLVNSLTVTNNSFWEFIHLNFGYHTEHHIFPRMSGQYVKIVSEQLKKQFPERYNIMPKSEALKKLYNTPRVYKDRNTLIHPETHHTVETIVQAE